MNYWLFQANPKNCALDEWLTSAVVGTVHGWRVTRYRASMQPGDLVALWKSGPGGGLIASGTLTDSPRSAVDGDFVEFRLDAKAEHVVTRAELKADPVLRDLLILRQANATNFRLSEADWDALQELSGLATPKP